MKMGEKMLTKHITEIHEGKQFLNAHVALVHEGKKPFKCEICDVKNLYYEYMRHLTDFKDS